MFSPRFTLLFTGLALSAAAASAQSIAFTGINADGLDDLSFVALSSIGNGTTIFFTDNEWNGTGWTDANENAFTWTASSAIAAGTIVTLSNVTNAITNTATSNLGTIATIAAAGDNGGIGNSNEAIFAFTGTYAAPTLFLTAIGNDTVANTSNVLTGTGLTSGVNAFFLPGDEDIMAYIGPRSGQSSFAGYLPFLTDASNWITQDAGGDQSIDGTAPDVPFSTQPFTITAPIPEPGTYAVMAGLVAAAFAMIRRRR